MLLVTCLPAAAPQSALLSSYTYTNQQWISDPGDARVHYNLWLQNGARPRWGRRTHGIIHGEARPRGGALL